MKPVKYRYNLASTFHRGFFFAYFFGMVHGHYMVSLLRPTKSPTIGEEVVHQLCPPREQHPLRVIADRRTRQENAAIHFYEGPLFIFYFYFSASLSLTLSLSVTSLTPTLHSTSTSPNHNLPNSIQNSGFLIIPKLSVLPEKEKKYKAYRYSAQKKEGRGKGRYHGKKNRLT